jgi:hypothetical protein
MKLIALTVILGGCLAGCVINSNDAMPSNWPRISKFAKAGELSGVFSGKDSILGAVMSGDQDYNLVASADEFHISILSETQLEIKAFTGAKLLRSKVMDYRFEDGAVVLDKSRGLNREGVLAHEKIVYKFIPTASHDLVVKYEGKFAGMMLLIPAFGSETKWWLVRKVR